MNMKNRSKCSSCGARVWCIFETKEKSGSATLAHTLSIVEQRNMHTLGRTLAHSSYNKLHILRAFSETVKCTNQQPPKNTHTHTHIPERKLKTMKIYVQRNCFWSMKFVRMCVCASVCYPGVMCIGAGIFWCWRIPTGRGFFIFCKSSRCSGEIVL